MIRIHDPQERKSRSSVNTDGRVVRTRAEKRLIDLDPNEAGEISRDLVEQEIALQGFTAGAFHADGLCRLREVDIDEKGINGKKHFWVTLSYSSETPEVEEEEQDNPLSKPPVYSWTDSQYMAPVAKDIHGTAILNTAKAMYVTAPEQPRTRDLLTVERNEAHYDPAKARQYKNKTNASAFAGAAPGTLRCNSVRAGSDYSNGIRFWKVTYEFEYEPDGWDAQLLEADVYELNDDGERVPIKDPDTDQQITTPAMLDANGKVIPTDQLPDATVYTEWETYYRIDFRGLGL